MNYLNFSIIFKASLGKHIRLLPVLIFVFAITQVRAAGGDTSKSDLFPYLPEHVAVIGQQKITKKSLIKHLLEKFPETQFSSLGPEEVKALLTEFLEREINRHIMRGILQKSGITPSAELVKTKILERYNKLRPEQQHILLRNLKQKETSFEEYLRDACQDPDEQLRVAVDLWVEKFNGAKISVTDDETEDYYRLRQEFFLRPRQVALVQFIVSQDKNKAHALKMAKTIYSRLLQNEPPKQILTDFKKQNANVKIELKSGKFKQDELPAQLGRAIFASKEGKNFRIVDLGEAYIVLHIIKILPATYVPFAEIKSYLQEELRLAKTKAFIGQLLKQRRAKLQVKLLF